MVSAYVSAGTYCFLLVTISADAGFCQAGNSLPYLLITLDVYYDITPF